MLFPSRFVQRNTFNVMDLCSVTALLYKSAMHGLTIQLIQFLRNRENLKLMFEFVV